MTDQSIYLVRHGETAFNADGRLRGLADPDLNAAGLGQATRLAESIFPLQDRRPVLRDLVLHRRLLR
jgi:broad specificity phosphatase PhoE